jgi:hypothetical protein
VCGKRVVRGLAFVLGNLHPAVVDVDRYRTSTLPSSSISPRACPTRPVESIPRAARAPTNVPVSQPAGARRRDPTWWRGRETGPPRGRSARPPGRASHSAAGPVRPVCAPPYRAVPAFDPDIGHVDDLAHSELLPPAPRPAARPAPSPTRAQSQKPRGAGSRRPW